MAPNLPPVIKLVGSPNTTARLLSVYIDAGATAAKPGSPAPVAVSVSGFVNTSSPSLTVLTFTATDSSGLSAAPVQRWVTVLDPCPPPSALCGALSSAATYVCSSCTAAGDCLCLPPVASGGKVASFTPPAYGSAPTVQLIPGTVGQPSAAALPDGTPVLTHTVNISSEWSDPGVASCTDPIDGQLGAAAVSATPGALGPVSTAAPTAVGAPFSITYSCRNGGGLVGRALRRVVVVNPCYPPGVATLSADNTSVPCSDGGCSSGGVCAAVGLSYKSSKSAAAPGVPRVVLQGPATVTLTAGQAYTACGASSPLSSVCDRGATATAAGGGSLTPVLAVCAADPTAPLNVNSFASAGLAGCETTTNGSMSAASGVWSVPGVYNISFSAFDAFAGTWASATRSVTVQPACGLGERACSSALVCSQAGYCASELASLSASASSGGSTAAAAALNLTLRTSTILALAATVPQHSAYALCAPGTAPAAHALCELGAVATDLDGVTNLTSLILACPPADCLPQGCPSWRLAAVGLGGCLDTGAPVGTVFTLKFVVFSLAAPAQSASVQRVITIGPPCDVGHFYCASGCIPLPCESASTLLKTAPSPVPVSAAAAGWGDAAALAASAKPAPQQKPASSLATGHSPPPAGSPPPTKVRGRRLLTSRRRLSAASSDTASLYAALGSAAAAGISAANASAALSLVAAASAAAGAFSPAALGGWMAAGASLVSADIAQASSSESNVSALARQVPAYAALATTLNTAVAGAASAAAAAGAPPPPPRPCALRSAGALDVRFTVAALVAASASGPPPPMPPAWPPPPPPMRHVASLSYTLPNEYRAHPAAVLKVRPLFVFYLLRFL